jgi:hypothetical protein
MTENNVNYELFETLGGKAVKVGNGKTFDPTEEFSKLSDSEKSEFTKRMIEVIEKNATEKKKRQGQKKANGKTAIPKPVCSKCGEILIRIYTQRPVDGKRRFIKSGWSCPSVTCDYIIKDMVELTEEESEE